MNSQRALFTGGRELSQDEMDQIHQAAWSWKFEDFRIEKVEGRQGVKFAVRTSMQVLGKKGHWEFEPSPSSRTDEFLEEFRFDSFSEAFDALRAYQALDPIH